MRGRGLGHEFLRHIERTALIVQVVDLTGDWEGARSFGTTGSSSRELALYADELAARPRIVVANKIDVPGTEGSLRKLAARVREDSIAAAGGNEFVESPIDPKLYRISALTGAGVDSLKAAIATKVHALREAAREHERHPTMQYECIWEGAKARAGQALHIISEGLGRIPFPACRWSAWWCRPTGRTRRRSPSSSTGSSAWGWTTALEGPRPRRDECASSASPFAFESPGRCGGRLPGAGYLMSDATHRRKPWW